MTPFRNNELNNCEMLKCIVSKSQFVDLYFYFLFPRNKKFTNNFQIFFKFTRILFSSIRVSLIRSIKVNTYILFLEIKLITHFIYASYVRDYVLICIPIA